MAASATYDNGMYALQYNGAIDVDRTRREMEHGNGSGNDFGIDYSTVGYGHATAQDYPQDIAWPSATPNWNGYIPAESTSHMSTGEVYPDAYGYSHNGMYAQQHHPPQQVYRHDHSGAMPSNIAATPLHADHRATSQLHTSNYHTSYQPSGFDINGAHLDHNMDFGPTPPSIYTEQQQPHHNAPAHDLRYGHLNRFIFRHAEMLNSTQQPVAPTLEPMQNNRGGSMSTAAPPRKMESNPNPTRVQEMVKYVVDH